MKFLFLLIFVSCLVLLSCVFIPSNKGYDIGWCDWLQHKCRRLMISMGQLTMDAKACEEMLRVFNRVCQKHGVEFWLAEGTALGAVREGGIIAGDTDVDVCMYPPYWPAFYNQVIQELIQENGFRLFRDFDDFDFVTLEYRGQYLDVNSIVPGKYCTSVPGPCDELIPHIGPLSPVKLGNDTYMAPGELYLEFLYGSTWRIPRYRFKPIDARKEKQHVD
jgi:hypothetical protein